VTGVAPFRGYSDSWPYSVKLEGKNRSERSGGSFRRGLCRLVIEVGGIRDDFRPWRHLSSAPQVLDGGAMKNVCPAHFRRSLVSAMRNAAEARRRSAAGADFDRCRGRGRFIVQGEARDSSGRNAGKCVQWVPCPVHWSDPSDSSNETLAMGNWSERDPATENMRSRATGRWLVG
jgi:hypothetical protein